jgi:folate-binding protein YgfZ
VLRDTLLRSGAVIDGASSRPLHFGGPEAELGAALRLAALADRSDQGRVLGQGPDLLDLLQRLSTAQLAELEPDSGKPTVLTSPKGRIVERLFVHRLEEGLLLVGGPGSAQRVIAHLDRYTFSEQTGLTDVGEETCQLVLVGPRAADALLAAGLAAPERFHSVRADFEGSTIHVLGEDGLSGDGFSVVAPARLGGSLWQSLVLAVSKFDGRPAGEEALEAWRILRGLPAPGHELTEDHNPLEAGLEEAVSFDKGCYVGQEVVARLNTYDKIARKLCGLELAAGAACPAPGTALFKRGREVGRLTSAVLPPGFDHPVGLAYLKRRELDEAEPLAVGAANASAIARLVELPFALNDSQER